MRNTKTNKRERILRAVEENPTATPEQILEILRDQAVDVTLGYVRKIGFPAIRTSATQQTQGEKLRSVCRVCHSAGFVYHHTKTLRHFGSNDGEPFNRITWKRGKCPKCGTWETHKFWHWENEPEPTKSS